MTRRGNALMTTLIALAVLMLLVAAAIQFTGQNREAAVARSRAEEMQSCADAARKVLMSRLRTFGVPTANLTLNTTLPDTTNVANAKQLRTAHVGAAGVEPVIVKLTASTMGSSRTQARDVSNVLAGTTLGGDYYRVVVSCRDPSSKSESEVEFTFRHGL